MKIVLNYEKLKTWRILIIKQIKNNFMINVLSYQGS